MGPKESWGPTDLYSSPLEILSCIDLEFRRTSLLNGQFWRVPDEFSPSGERDSWNKRIAELDKYKKKDGGKEGGDRGKGIEILETRILVKAGIHRENERKKTSRLGSSLRSWIFIETDSKTDTINHVSFPRPFVEIRLDKKGRRKGLDPSKSKSNTTNSSISLRSMRCSIYREGF